MTYQLRLYDRHRTLLEVLDRIDQPTFTRRANEATEVSVTIPRGDIKLDRAELAGFLQVWQDGERKVSGRIGDRSVQQGHVTLTALTEEILLAANIDRKSTRLNSSHVAISYAVFCLKKKKQCKEMRI